MTEDDVDRMKDFCSGEEGIPTGVLDAISTGRKFFRLLRRHNYLDRHNLLYLQAMLWNLGKKRRILYKKLSEFAKRCEVEPLNFFTTEEKIMAGFLYVHFHVAGTDTSARDINRLRALVSTLVNVPLHLVHLSGVKPYRSIIITFRLPVDVVQALTQLTAEEKGLLLREGIDSFFLNTAEIRIAHEKADIPARLSERDEVIKLMNRNRKLEKEVESRLLDLSEEERKIDQLKEYLHQINDSFRTALTILMNARQIQMPIDFDKETVLDEKIKEFDAKYPRCSKEMHELLQLQAEIVQQAQVSEWGHYINTMVTKCEVLYRQLHCDLYEPCLPRDTDPDYLSRDNLPSEPSTPDKSAVSWVSGEEEVLKEISMGLNDDQRSAMIGSIAFSDGEEKLLKKSPQDFLRLIIRKDPIPEGKDIKQYLIDKLQASGVGEHIEHVTRCFDATTCPATCEGNIQQLDHVHPTVKSTPKAGQTMLRRCMSDVFPKSLSASYTADDMYQKLAAFRDIIPELLKQLPATDSLKHKTLRVPSTPEVV